MVSILIMDAPKERITQKVVGKSNQKNKRFGAKAKWYGNTLTPHKTSMITISIMITDLYS